jgi:hypothetical protein
MMTLMVNQGMIDNEIRRTLCYIYLTDTGGYIIMYGQYTMHIDGALHLPLDMYEQYNVVLLT